VRVLLEQAVAACEGRKGEDGQTDAGSESAGCQGTRFGREERREKEYERPTGNCEHGKERPRVSSRRNTDVAWKPARLAEQIDGRAVG
jgi:hypothetical protein